MLITFFQCYCAIQSYIRMGKIRNTAMQNLIKNAVYELEKRIIILESWCVPCNSITRPGRFRDTVSEDWICSQCSILSLLILSRASHVAWAAAVLSEAWCPQLSKHEENNFFFFQDSLGIERDGNASVASLVGKGAVNICSL